MTPHKLTLREGRQFCRAYDLGMCWELWLSSVSVIPMPGFDKYDDARAHDELVSTGVDVSEPDELALHDTAFNSRSSASCYGDGSKDLITKALVFWSND
ncbi:hypothetical protein ACFYTG_11820 [Streptomyces mirabilis]|uniref:hypothetical protein n=1 Tax=Streptomyces mirabilis TaxID=68239 RepID=UPI0036C30522